MRRQRDRTMTVIEPMTEGHRNAVLEMMRIFYTSPAVWTNGSEEIFQRDIAACVDPDDPYLEGFVFTAEGTVTGYAMIAKSFSTEFGRPCIWIEDLYLQPPYRGMGTAGRFFTFLEEKFPGCIFRLEAERENQPALRAYRKSGFGELPYLEMKKETAASRD